MTAELAVGVDSETIPHLTIANRSGELSAIAETELLGIMKDLGPRTYAANCRRGILPRNTCRESEFSPTP